MTKPFGKVGVLYGGRSSERNVSLMSGQGVYDALIAQGIDAHLFDTGLLSLTELVREQFERVFIALHGEYGEDGSLQGALEQLGIPYTGSGVLASSLAMDKVMTKRIWQQIGLPTPRFIVSDNLSEIEQFANESGYPIILKTPRGGSTLGVVKVSGVDELASAYAEIQKYDSHILVEQFITGREVTVAVIERDAQVEALPIVEIVAPLGNYDYDNKYFNDQTKYSCPAALSDRLTRTIQDYCTKAFLSLGCVSWGRVDVMLDHELTPYLLEINTSPGMTSHSLVPMAARVAGWSYADLCKLILSQARCKQHANFLA